MSISFHSTENVLNPFFNLKKRKIVVERNKGSGSYPFMRQCITICAVWCNWAPNHHSFDWNIQRIKFIMIVHTWKNIMHLKGPVFLLSKGITDYSYRICIAVQQAMCMCGGACTRSTTYDRVCRHICFGLCVVMKKIA